MDATTIRLVGLAEISNLLGVKPETPRMWRQRGVLPPALQELAMGPVWLEDDIIGWARDTGRLPNDQDE